MTTKLSSHHGDFPPRFFPFRKTSLEMKVTAVEYWPFVTSSIRPPDRLAVF